MARRVLIFSLLALTLIAAAGVVGWRLNLRERSRYTDANTINTPVASAPIRQILWQPAAPLPDAGDISADQYEPRISADGQLMIFVRGRPGAREAGRNADLFQCRRTPDGWSAPEPVAAINTESDELGPELSADGRTLYFYSDRTGTLGGYDLWLARRDDGGDWKEPVNLGQSVNSEFNEYGPALTPDNERLFFSSNRPRPGDPPQLAQRDPWPATLRENRSRHDYDLYVADLLTSGLADAEPVRELNTPHDEGAPALSPAGDFLYFASDRPQTTGGFDIFRSRILRGEIQPPENLGLAINSTHNDLDPSLSTDGFRIYFSSDRKLAHEVDQASPPAAEVQPSPAPTTTRADEPARYSLYSSASREVFIETDPLHAASLLARLWAAAWPWLLALLAALILATLFYLAMRDAEIRHRLAQLSLMAKCLLISLLIHAALLSAFAAWRVGTAIGEMLDGGGRGDGTQVTLGASAGSGSLESQIRGTFATVGIEAPAIEASRPETTPLEIHAPTIQVATTPANLTFTRSPIAFRPEDASGTIPSPTPAPLAPALNEQALATRAPAAEPAAATSSESRSEIAPDSASLHRRAASIAGTPATPDSIAVNPTAAQIATPPSAAGNFTPDAPTSIGAAAPTAANSPALTNVAPSATTASRLPTAPGTSATTAEPASATGSVADRLASTSQPTAPGATGTSSVAINPGAAPIGTPSPNTAGVSHSDASSTVAAGTPAANISPSLQAATSPDAATARLPVALSRSARGAEPSAASGSIASTTLPSTTQPALPGAVGASRIAIAPSAAPMAATPGRASAFTPTDAPASGSSTPGAQGATPVLPSIRGTTLAARLPGAASTPGTSAASESTSATPGTVPSTLGDSAPSRPTLSLGTPSGSSSVHLAPTTSGSGTQAPSPSANFIAPTEAGGLAGNPAPPPRGSDLKGLPSIAFKSNLPAIPAPPADPPKTTPAPKPENFAQRAPEVREQVLKKTGGSPETERAVAAALDWFKTHQSTDGRWSGQHFDRNCTHCSSPAEIDADAAMTGITLLCFLGAGHTHLSDGPHKDGVRKALSWIVNRTDSSGDLRRGETMYSQTIAAIALCEAFAMTRDPWLETPARRAITFVARGATRDGRGSDSSDTSVLGWQIMAVKSAQRAGFDVPTTAFDNARRWLEQTSSRNNPGRYAYAPGQQPNPAATAEAMFVQQLLGHSRDEPRMRQSADFILTAPPAWRREAPTYYWYYATLALFQQQGDHWKTWNEGIARELIRNQHQDGPSQGSWDPQDPWSRLGGRVYQTAVCTLSLEVYYRYRLAEPAAP